MRGAVLENREPRPDRPAPHGRPWSTHGMDAKHPMHLGDPALDEDHARLRELIEDMLQSTSATSVATLDAVHAHAQRHFAEEDVDLRTMRGGNASCHIDEHAAVLKSLVEVREVLLGESSSEGDKALLLQRLARQLLSWLPEHVQEMDRAVAMERTKARFGGVAIRMPGRGVR